jgi:hypothetical protein
LLAGDMRDRTMPAELVVLSMALIKSFELEVKV